MECRGHKADKIQEVTASRLQFVKPVEMYEVLAAYGSNVLVTEGESWKRHRRISAPAFSEVTKDFGSLSAYGLRLFHIVAQQ